jgi:hypothetical protein
MNGKYTFNTTKSPPAQTKKNEVRDNRENSARDRSAEFGGANPKKKNNNASVAISLVSTVGSCCVFYILLFAQAYTN